MVQDLTAVINANINHRHKQQHIPMTKRSAAASDTAVMDAVSPVENDVLCSKDKTHSANPGNRLFRERIEAFKEIYQKTNNKQGKMDITRSIVKELKNSYGTRFLKRDANTGVWVEISDQASRDKVSHALRFATRSRGKKPSVPIRRSKGLMASAQGNQRPSPPSSPQTTPTVVPRNETPATASPTKVTVAREVSVDATAVAEATAPAPAEGTVAAVPAAAATVQVPTISFLSSAASDPATYFGRTAEHTEASKWLLALRQGV